MKRLIVASAILALGSLLFAQNDQNEPQERRLPDGRLQSEAILEDEYEKTLEDARELAKLAEQLKDDLESHDGWVLSVKSIRTVEQIEKLAKQVKKRLKRH